MTSMDTILVFEDATTQKENRLRKKSINNRTTLSQWNTQMLQVADLDGIGINVKIIPKIISTVELYLAFFPRSH